GQFVIDRRLVPVLGRNGVGISVLLDQANSGNAAASMLELTFKDGAALAMAKVDRHEVWYITAGTGVVKGAGAAKAITFDAGSVIDVPAGGYREVTASASGVSAVVFLVPGQREGIARSGAMPGDSIGTATAPKGAAGPSVITAAKATDYKADKRVVHIYLDSAAKG